MIIYILDHVQRWCAALSWSSTPGFLARAQSTFFAASNAATNQCWTKDPAQGPWVWSNGLVKSLKGKSKKLYLYKWKWKLFHGICHLSFLHCNRNNIDSTKSIWIIRISPKYCIQRALVFSIPSNRHHSHFKYKRFGSPYFSLQAFYQGLVDDHAYVKERRKVLKRRQGISPRDPIVAPLAF